MSLSPLQIVTWGTVFAAIVSALLLMSNSGSVADVESLTEELRLETDHFFQQSAPAPPRPEQGAKSGKRNGKSR